MKDKVLATIKQFNMLSNGDTVAVGLSGGADSMTLIYLLNELKDELGISVIAAHLNHGIRGGEADRDEKFVVDFCKSAGIDVRILRLDIPSAALESGESIELCARRKRYEFFDSLGADKIATAHTGSDRIETLLMNLSRGAGLSGLCSIPPVRGNIIRPLIEITREEIELFCKEHSIKYVNDSTNFTDEYTRNKYRLNVIPELKKINPSFEINALRCLKILNSENEIIDSLSDYETVNRIEETGSLDISDFGSISKALKNRIITSYLKKINCDFEAKHIDFITENSGNSFSLILPGAVKLSSDSKKLFVEKHNDLVTSLEETGFTKTACKDNMFTKFGVSFCISDKISSDDSSFFAADADKIAENFTLRSRNGGDVFHFNERHCSKTLKKLFNELKIPKENRDKICVIADENGLIYVDGIGVDAKRAVSSQTKHFLIIKTECGNNE